MHKGIFSRLAKQNIRNNKSTYIPYMITCIFCIAMIYMMEFLRDCPTLDQAVRQADEVRMIVFTGEIVVEIFCIIFLIYSNSFLMKRRQKEIGLYNILGLERNHIGIVMFLETIITSIGSFAGGIAAGIIGSKLALLLLLKLLHIPSVLGFYISVKGIFTCLFMFGIIFLMILFLNLAKIHLSRPVELLRGNNTGEKEPAAKWLMALIGFICLGAGYYLAVTTESPIKAITIFLLAVILVMAGTYLLFTAGSIVILKFLRRRKSFYYRTGNFISISGMLYRMKQNAIGLASICILSTGVLLMISMTVSIYFGMNDIMLNRYPYDVDMSVTSISEDECQTAIEAFEKAIADNKVPVERSVEEIYLDIVCSKNGDQILIKPANTIRNSDSVLVLSLFTQAEYERLTGISANLNDGEIFAWYPSAVQKDSVTVDETEFTVKKWLDKNPLTCGEDAVSDNAVLVVTDEDFKKFDEMRTEMYKGVSSAPAGEDLTLHLGLDITGSETDKIDFGTPVMEVVKDLKKNGGLSENSWITSGIRQQEYESYYADNGSLLFIGIFLGSLFLMGTAMIIYYKQISEGYEDQKRFEIMQKVGLSRREVRSSVRRQILMVFFLPLLMAMLHITMAFPMIRRMLLLFGMTNTKLFIGCTAGTVLIFAVVYGLIYLMTARSYYHIIERK
ncbi:ABC transporter permease [Ruminococcus sp. TF11-2AC]|jgi:putative ABC transport system permease protein|uniref:FtsX-like permease family protein n=1 Tax=Blautia sp. Marseille-P2398 TaxID=1805476 RepID=UPI000789BC3D|nr:FtsX-like permease family protein [Blautia sp. Marseille-P2398]RHU50742.1 ABC transporter permease [Ruminococcus sp. TF11-2AC]